MTDPKLFAILCALDAVCLGAGTVAMLKRGFHGRASEVVWNVGIAGLAGIAFTVTASPWRGFAVMRAMCHALFCVVLPLVALRAVRVRRQCPWLAATALGVAVVGEVCYVWARRVEPFRLEVTTASVTSPRLSGLAKPVRIALVADLQPEAIGPHEVAAFDAIVAAEPDLVLFLGDTLPTWEPYLRTLHAPLLEQLRRLRPPLGAFAVEGDVDGIGVERVFAGSDVRVLTDAHVELPGVPIDLIGLSRARSRRPPDVGLVRRLRGDRFPIVMGHAPDFMLGPLEGGLQVPLFGPIVTLSSVPRWLAAGGVFRHGTTWLAVSRGVGMERDDAPRIRFWCRPQLVLLDLEGG
jgi:hypothetical protein